MAREGGSAIVEREIEMVEGEEEEIAVGGDIGAVGGEIGAVGDDKEVQEVEEVIAVQVSVELEWRSLKLLR